eukprot:6017305-Pleurochrysis_carterae.AAC.1
MRSGRGQCFVQCQCFFRVANETLFAAVELGLARTRSASSAGCAHSIGSAAFKAVLLSTIRAFDEKLVVNGDGAKMQP